MAAAGLSSCKTEDEETPVEIVPIATQNTNDDAAAQKFMKDNYFDPQGKITEFSATDAADDNYPNLLSYAPVTLTSGVIIIKRPDAQPVAGKTIESGDVLTLSAIANSYVARQGDAGAVFASKVSFINTIDVTGVPDVDPSYFYTRESKLFGQPRSFYEIEGFQEGIKYFKSCEISSNDNYNLQGAIIIPSRAGFARDSNVYSAVSGALFNDRSFVFNVQVYKTKTRTPAEQ